MAKGRSPGDWTVTHDNDEGTVRSAEYAGRFKVRQSGVVQVIWSLGKGPEPKNSGPVNQAAQEAIARALWP